MQLIATGSSLDLLRLGDYEGRLDEGDRGLLELDVRWAVSGQTAAALESRLRAAGVKDVKVTTSASVVRIGFTKGFPWLAVIAAGIVAMAILIILVIGFRLFREVAAASPVVLSIGLIAAAILGLAFLSRGSSPRRRSS